MHADTPMGASSAQPRVEQLDALTSLRFFAALLVVWFHYELLFVVPVPEVARFGYTGVTFFFVLSGFILAHNYRSADFSDRETVWRYLTARVARIWPLYIVTLVLGIPLFAATLAAAVQPALQPVKASALVLAPLGLQAWVPGSGCILNCPAWSISAELFFYVTLPFVLAAILRRPLAWLAGVAAAWLVITACYALLWQAVGDGGSVVPFHPAVQAEVAAQFIKFFPLGRLPEFLLGVALYGLWSWHRDRVPGPALMLAIAAAALALWVLLPIVPSVFAHNGLTAIFWVPLIWWAAGLRGGALCHPAMVFLGKISFALYLLHVPFGAMFVPLEASLGSPFAGVPIVRLLVAVGALLALSAMLHLRCEEPWRRPLAARLMELNSLALWRRRPA